MVSALIGPQLAVVAFAWPGSAKLATAAAAIRLAHTVKPKVNPLDIASTAGCPLAIWSEVLAAARVANRLAPGRHPAFW